MQEGNINYEGGCLCDVAKEDSHVLAPCRENMNSHRNMNCHMGLNIFTAVVFGGCDAV
jgi:hypothetical protein